MPLTIRRLLALGPCVAGCVNSGDVATGDLTLAAHADQDDSGTTMVWAPLYAAGRSVDIEEGDEQCIVVGGADVACILKGTTAFLQAELLPGSDTSAIGVELRRTEQVSALGTLIAVPDPFTLDDPGAAAEGSDLLLSWSPTASEPMRVSVDGACVEPAEEEIDDSGSWTLPGDVLTRTDDGSTDCTVTVTVERVRSGAVDDALDPASTAEGIQERSLRVTLAGA